MWVLMRLDGLFVARHGSEHSYTKRLQDAEIYGSREAAINDSCPTNEIAVELRDVVSA
jgi:hypothetical protein